MSTPYRRDLRVDAYLASLPPELDEEFLWLCDDFVLLRDLPEGEATRVRHLGHLGKVTSRGRGLWRRTPSGGPTTRSRGSATRG